MVTPASTPTDSGHGSTPGSCCTSKSPVCTVARFLIIVGGLNWGLVGLGGFFGSNLNVVNIILGGVPTVEYLVYVLVGVATVLKLARNKKSCK